MQEEVTRKRDKKTTMSAWVRAQVLNQKMTSCRPSATLNAYTHNQQTPQHKLLSTNPAWQRSEVGSSFFLSPCVQCNNAIANMIQHTYMAMNVFRDADPHLHFRSISELYNADPHLHFKSKKALQCIARHKSPDPYLEMHTVPSEKPSQSTYTYQMNALQSLRLGVIPQHSSETHQTEHAE